MSLRKFLYMYIFIYICIYFLLGLDLCQIIMPKLSLLMKMMEKQLGGK